MKNKDCLSNVDVNYTSFKASKIFCLSATMTAGPVSYLHALGNKSLSLPPPSAKYLPSPLIASFSENQPRPFY